MRAPALMEPTLTYHPYSVGILTLRPISGVGTMPGGQFDWGGRLLNSNGGARSYAQAVWKSADECKGISVVDCETYKSSRCESRT